MDHPIYAPLDKDHPLVIDNVRCLFCNKPFQEGDRVTLIPKYYPDRSACVPCNPTHARCAYQGLETPTGKIIDITSRALITEHGYHPLDVDKRYNLVELIESLVLPSKPKKDESNESTDVN